MQSFRRADLAGVAGLAATLVVSGCASPALQVPTAAELQAAVRRPDPDTSVIQLAPGVYFLDQPLVLDETFSGAPSRPRIIRGPKRGSAVLSGGRPLTALKWRKVDQRTWRAQVDGPAFSWLWLNGERLIRARYPNYDPRALPMGGVSADATSPARSARWADPAGGIIHALHASRWGDMHIAILGKRPDGALQLAPAVGNNREMGPSESERYVENIREELDAPGEWYLDTEGHWLYFMPHDDAPPPSDGFVASRLDTIVKIVGANRPVHDVILQNISTGTRSLPS